MAEPFTQSHWAHDQDRRREPRCVGTIREVSRDEFWIYAACDSCPYEVGISLPRGRELHTPEGAAVPAADSRIESSSEAPF